METKFILVRHGESLGNMRNMALGHTDLDLSPRGFEQAECTAKFLQNERIDAVYSSDLLRAHNTAAASARLHGLAVNDRRELRDWENRCIDDIIEKDPKGFIEGWRGHFGTFCVPGGESIPEARERFYSAMLKIAEENRGKTVLVAAHGGVIRAFWAKILEIKPENVATELGYPTNASCSFLTYDGERFIPGKYSVDEHLREIGVLKINF